MGIIIAEAETGSGALILIVGLHRVLQTACLADDRQGAIPQAHKLAQAAGFKERRHQEGIARRINLV